MAMNCLVPRRRVKRTTVNHWPEVRAENAMDGRHRENDLLCGARSVVTRNRTVSLKVAEQIYLRMKNPGIARAALPQIGVA
jgi:hypothetical protein